MVLIFFSLSTVMPLWLSRKTEKETANLSDIALSEDTERSTSSRVEVGDFASVLKDKEQLSLFYTFLTEEFSLENLMVSANRSYLLNFSSSMQ